MVTFGDLLGTGLSALRWEQVLLSLLLAVVLGKVVAITYDRTHFGLSYSRSFSQSLVLGALVASILMMSIADNLARGLGILGTMALVRFRTNIPDSRDMIFVFAALAVGVASGVRGFAVATLGALGFAAVAHLLNWEPSSTRREFDGLLRFWTSGDAAALTGAQGALDAHCRHYVLVAMRALAQGETTEYAYQVKLRPSATQQDLFRAIEALGGVGGVSFFLDDGSAEL
jgi:hypothetical protein